MLCDTLERWGAGGEEESRRRCYMYNYMAYLCYSTAETNTTLKAIFSQLKNKFTEKNSRSNWAQMITWVLVSNWPLWKLQVKKLSEHHSPAWNILGSTELCSNSHRFPGRPAKLTACWKIPKHGSGNNHHQPPFISTVEDSEKIGLS